MRISEKRLIEALANKEILPYEEELIEKLRDLNYRGIPLSIVLLSKELCRGECYVMSMSISRGMDSFTLVHGDVNFLSLNDEYPNHSWVEKDGFVYDTTDGLKWKKELYYELFKPVVREVYDEKTVSTYGDYQDVLSRSKKDEDMTVLALMIQHIEEIESEERYINHKRLLSEIALWREKHNIKDKFSDEAMKELKKIIGELQNSSS